MENIFSQKITIEKIQTSIPTEVINSSSKSYDIFKAIFAYDQNDVETYECFYAMYLNQAHKVVGIQRISEGAINATSAPVAKIAQGALLAHATSVVLCHNHPSGNLRPSHADIQITESAAKGLKLLEISVLDHLIISNNGYYSFLDESLI